MLKFENLANVGDVIRAYDFIGNKEAYVEGVVLEKGWIKHPVHGFDMYMGYSIRVEKDGVQEDFGREGDIAYVPFETSLEYDDRVELIDWDNRAEEELAIQMMKEVA
mgnify:CR=1 FL=1